MLIVNGTVYDGSVNPSRTSNIGISGNSIVTMDAAADAEAALRIDATGLAVVPGFIHPHTHAEDDLFEVPGNVNRNYLTPGVTTVFIGNDGDGILWAHPALNAKGLTKVSPLPLIVIAGARLPSPLRGSVMSAG